jgi:hypothetical protein
MSLAFHVVNHKISKNPIVYGGLQAHPPPSATSLFSKVRAGHTDVALMSCGGVEISFGAGVDLWTLTQPAMPTL